MKVLRDRVGQLNDIATAKADFVSGTMPTSTGVSTQSVSPAGLSPAIELNLLLQQIQDSLLGGEAGRDEDVDGGDHKLNKFDLATASRALGLIFRMVPESGSDFIEDLQAKVQNILQLLNGSLDDEQESAGMPPSARETALSLQTIFTRLNVYLTRMIAGAPVQRQETRFNPLTGQQEQVNILSQEQGQNLSNPERLALSKNLVSSLGFSKMLKYAVDDNPSGLLNEADRNRLFTAQQAQRFRTGDMDDEGDDDDDDGDFDRPAEPREDEAHDNETGVERSSRGFDEDERNVFGFNSGMYYPTNGRGEDEYFGEDRFEAQSQAPSVYLGKQGHQNRERTSRGTPASAVDEVRGMFDPDTQAFNIGFTAPRRPSPATSISSIPIAPPTLVADAPRAPSRAPSRRSTATRSVSTRTNPDKTEGAPARVSRKHYNKLPTRFATANADQAIRLKRELGERGQVITRLKSRADRGLPPAPPAFKLPTRQSELPTTREGFVALAAQINANGGINGAPIMVYATAGPVSNIKKRFVQRLGLAGKY